MAPLTGSISWEAISLVVGVLGVVLAIVSFVWAVHQARLSKRHLELLLTRVFSWEAIQALTKDLAEALDGDRPDLILTTPGAPMMVTGLVIEQLQWRVPCHIVLVSEAGLQSVGPAPAEPDYMEVNSNIGRMWHIPRAAVLSGKRRPEKVAIIDDLAMESVYYDRLVDGLANLGFPADGIKSYVLVKGENLKDRPHPQFYSRMINDERFVLPWGQQSR